MKEVQMLPLHYTRARLLLPLMLLAAAAAAAAAAQRASDKDAAGKPGHPPIVVLDELRTATSHLEIVNGTPAGPSDNRFQVGLLVKNIPENFYAQFCGGSLIAPDVVVTAAHCNYYQTTQGGPLIAWQAAEVQVLTGARSLQTGGVRRDVTAIWQHPKYTPSNQDYDVAVWKLASRTEGIPSALLATSDGTAGSALLVTGWGTTSEGGEKSAILLKVSVPIVSHQACSDAYEGEASITPRMLCAGFATGGKDSCQGDSGGPATRGAGDTVLTGIVSWGFGCARDGRYGVYTRVSDPEIQAFIRERLK
jgi:secreted trypsin-like serine protease